MLQKTPSNEVCQCAGGLSKEKIVLDSRVDLILLDSQLRLWRWSILWLELFYPFDEIGLLKAAFTLLVPVAEDFLEIANFKFLQIDRVEVNLFIYKKIEMTMTLILGLLLVLTKLEIADLHVLLFKLLADLISRHRPTDWLWNFT